MPITVVSRGRIVGEMLAQANLRSITASPSTVSDKGSRLPPALDPAELFRDNNFANSFDCCHGSIDVDGNIAKIRDHDQDVENSADAKLIIIHHDRGVSLKIESPAGKLELSVEDANGTLPFAGTSLLAGVRGQFSGSVHSCEKNGVSEYMLEYSDIEVNTFSETLTVDDISGAILSVDSAEADQDDGPGGKCDTVQVDDLRDSQDKYGTSYDDEQVGP